jgi:Amt family ammonium transporter
MKKLQLLFLMATGAVLLLVGGGEVAAQDAGATETLVSLRTGLDYVWILAASALVFLMQAGFMALESGMARAKNSINIAIKNLTDFIIAVAGFWAVGFGLMFGVSNGGLFGTTDFFMDIGDNSWRAVFFVFQAVFVGTAATIDSGAVAERTKFSAYVIVSAVTSVLIYPVFGHWAWGSFLNGTSQGWLEARGFLDFAGSTVVHSVGAWVALAGVIIVGPRIGRFGPNGESHRIPPHNLVLVYLGTFILFFGWFGFNAGSTLSATPAIAAITLNTILAASFGGITSAGMSWIFSNNRLPEAEAMANGVLGGLVGITAGCAFVEASGAVAIGIVAGALVYGGTLLLERFQIDDVVGAIPVHGFCGVWGTIAVGIFITPEALAITGNTRIAQIGVQALGVGAAFLWAFPIAFLVETLIRVTIGIRVSPEEEAIGLNIAEHGATSSLLGLAQSMAVVGGGGQYDASLKVEVERGTEIGELTEYFNRMLDALIEQNDQIARTSHEQATAMERLAQARAQEQALREDLERNRASADAELSAFSDVMERNVDAISMELDRMNTVLQSSVGLSDRMSESFGTMVQDLEELLQSVNGVSRNTAEAGTLVVHSSERVQHAVTTVTQLVESTRDIESIVATINEISERTRILSVNAGIEAARAGDAGRGFRVVAGEVKQLAGTTAASARTIVDHLGHIRGMSTSATEAIHAINEVIARVDAIHREIGTAMARDTEAAGTIRELVSRAREDIASVRRTVVELQSGALQVGERVRDSHSALRSVVEVSQAD